MEKWKIYLKKIKKRCLIKSTIKLINWNQLFQLIFWIWHIANMPNWRRSLDFLNDLTKKTNKKLLIIKMYWPISRFAQLYQRVVTSNARKYIRIDAQLGTSICRKRNFQRTRGSHWFFENAKWAWRTLGVCHDKGNLLLYFDYFFMAENFRPLILLHKYIIISIFTLAFSFWFY